MPLSRRKFLQLLAGSTLLARVGHLAAQDSLFSTDEDVLLGGGRYVDLDKPDQVHFVLSAVNLQQGRSQQIALEFLAHGMAVSPLKATRLLVFEKIGPGAAEIDLGTGQVVRPIATSPDRLFYGHGAFSTDAQYVFCTETAKDTEQGFIAIRDAATLARLGDMPSYGKHPHDCLLLPDGKTMAVTNGGGERGAEGEPCVAYVDLVSGRLIERVVLSNPDLNAGHLAVASGGALVVSSAPRRGMSRTSLGGVSLRKKTGALVSMKRPPKIVNRMRGEALSIAIHAGLDVAAITHPGGDMVTFWSVSTQRFLKMVELPHARGVALNLARSHFLVTYGADTLLAAVDARTLNLAPDPFSDITKISGSHLYNWSHIQRHQDSKAG